MAAGRYKLRSQAMVIIEREPRHRCDPRVGAEWRQQPAAVSCLKLDAHDLAAHSSAPVGHAVLPVPERER